MHEKTVQVETDQATNAMIRLLIQRAPKLYGGTRTAVASALFRAALVQAVRELGWLDLHGGQEPGDDAE